MILKTLEDKGLLRPPKWLTTNTHYLTMMGSVAYGVSDDTSDLDIYGWAIPPKTLIFPHLDGEIPGFGRQIQRFEQFQHHHVHDHPREYDFTVYSIVKYFQLCMECNPNMLDSLFVPQVCILHSTKIANMVRENRHLFLSKLAWHKYKGYAYSQMHKMNNIGDQVRKVRAFEASHNIPHSTTLKDIEAELKNDGSNSSLTSDELWEYYNMFREGTLGSTRFESRKIHDTDLKFMYHLVRLLSEIEQILTHGDLDLQEKGRREHMKAIRRGEVPKEDVIRWASDKEKQLEKVYHESTLPYKPQEKEIRSLLLNCLEEHFGDLSNCVGEVSEPTEGLREIDKVLKKYARFLK